MSGGECYSLVDKVLVHQVNYSVVKNTRCNSSACVVVVAFLNKFDKLKRNDIPGQ